MLKYARIITDDARFARMLTIELSEIGVNVINDELSLKSLDDGTVIYTVADLDFCFSEDISEFARNSKVIGFSRFYAEEIQDKAKECSAFFHRPFLISDFISAFDAVEKTTVRQMSHARVQKKIGNTIENERSAYVTVDHSSQCAVFGDRRIPLSDNEYRVLRLLCERRGEIISRDEILSALGEKESNICDVYICYLRRKIDNKLGLKLICTVRGKGYMLKS